MKCIKSMQYVSIFQSLPLSRTHSLLNVFLYDFPFSHAHSSFPGPAASIFWEPLYPQEAATRPTPPHPSLPNPSEDLYKKQTNKKQT